jgi:hypothetical protein
MVRTAANRAEPPPSRSAPARVSASAFTPSPTPNDAEPTSSSPHALLGQCSPIASARNPVGEACASARSAAQSAIAAIHAPYCDRAAGTSPFHPWLNTNTSVTPVRASASAAPLSLPRSWPLSS